MYLSSLRMRTNPSSPCRMTLLSSMVLCTASFHTSDSNANFRAPGGAAGYEGREAIEGMGRVPKGWVRGMEFVLWRIWCLGGLGSRGWWRLLRLLVS